MTEPSTSPKSASQEKIPFLQKGLEMGRILFYELRGVWVKKSVPASPQIVELYEAALREHNAPPLRSGRVLEIGFGARPYMMITLASMNIDAIGIDLDQPMMKGSPGEFRNIWKRNGFERALKSWVGFWLVFSPQVKRLGKLLATNGFKLVIPHDRLLVGNAAQTTIEPGSVDVIISDNVFEHIAPGDLENLLRQMKVWLKPDGIVLTRPNVYTGITGGHLIEWYPGKIKAGEEQQTEPWGHLLGTAPPANSYLNKISRREYDEMFAKDFTIESQSVLDPDIGRKFLTPELRERLSDYDDYELFSNQVLYVLRPRSTDTPD